MTGRLLLLGVSIRMRCPSYSPHLLPSYLGSSPMGRVSGRRVLGALQTSLAGRTQGEDGQLGGMLAEDILWVSHFTNPNIAVSYSPALRD